MKIQTYNQQQQISLINTLASNSKRAITLKEVWESTEVSFKNIETNNSIGVCKLLLLSEITQTVDLLKADMQEKHIDKFVNYILKHYYYFTISDITCFTDRLLEVKPFGKPNLNTMIVELNEYALQKADYAEQQQIKENSLHKADKVECDRFYKNYQKMKEKAQEPVPTQKEKDMEALKLNQKKLKELEKLYPDTDSEYLLRNM